MIAFQIGYHVAPGVFGRSVSGHVNICHIFAYKLGFQRFHFFVCLSAGATPRCPKIHQHHFTPERFHHFVKQLFVGHLRHFQHRVSRFLLVLLYFYQQFLVLLQQDGLHDFGIGVQFLLLLIGKGVVIPQGESDLLRTNEIKQKSILGIPHLFKVGQPHIFPEVFIQKRRIFFEYRVDRIHFFEFFSLFIGSNVVADERLVVSRHIIVFGQIAHDCHRIVQFSSGISQTLNIKRYIGNQQNSGIVIGQQPIKIVVIAGSWRVFHFLCGFGIRHLVFLGISAQDERIGIHQDIGQQKCLPNVENLLGKRSDSGRSTRCEQLFVLLHQKCFQLIDIHIGRNGKKIFGRKIPKRFVLQIGIEFCQITGIIHLPAVRLFRFKQMRIFAGVFGKIDQQFRCLSRSRLHGKRSRSQAKVKVGGTAYRNRRTKRTVGIDVHRHFVFFAGNRIAVHQLNIAKFGTIPPQHAAHNGIASLQFDLDIVFERIITGILLGNSVWFQTSVLEIHPIYLETILAIAFYKIKGGSVDRQGFKNEFKRSFARCGHPKKRIEVDALSAANRILLAVGQQITVGYDFYPPTGAIKSGYIQHGSCIRKGYSANLHSPIIAEHRRWQLNHFFICIDHCTRQRQQDCD